MPHAAPFECPQRSCSWSYFSELTTAIAVSPHRPRCASMADSGTPNDADSGGNVTQRGGWGEGQFEHQLQTQHDRHRAH